MRLGALAWRGLAARPLRTALTVAGVSLGVAIIAASLIAGQAATEAVRRAAQELLGSAQLRVRAFDTDGFTPRTVTALRQIPGVLNAAAVSEERGRGVAAEPDRAFSMLVIGVEPDEEEKVRTYEIVAGKFLDASDPAGVLVNAGWARDNGFELGDELLLNGRRNGVPPNHIVGMLGDSGFGALGTGQVMVMNRAFLENAFDVPVPVRYVDLQVAEGREADVQAQLDRTMTEPFVVETLADAERQLGQAQAGFSGLAFLFGLVALAVGAFLVANTLAMTVAERTREIGLLRAAGTTSRQVLWLFLRQGVVLAVAGGLIGTFLGLLLANSMIAFLESTRALLISGAPFSPAALLLAFALGAVVTLAGAVVPALAAARLSPLDALRPSRQPGRTLGGRLPWLAGLAILAVAVGAVAYPLQRGESSIGGVLLAVALLVGGAVGTALLLQPLATVVGRPFASFFGAQGYLGRANLGRDPVRTGLTVGALVIGLSSVVALGFVSGSARLTAERWVDSILPGGHAIRLGTSDDIESRRSVMSGIPGVKRASPVAEFPAVEVMGDQRREASIAGINPSAFQDSGSLLVEGSSREHAFQALRDGSAVLVPRAVAARDGLAVGDRLELALAGGDPQSFTVAGLVAYSLPTRTSDGALLISLADAQERFGVTEASLWTLEPDGSLSDTAFSSQVQKTANSLSAQALTARDLSSELSRSLDRIIGLFDVLALLAVVIGGLGIVNTLAVGVLERSREIAILRSHGMTIGQVQAMVVSEAGIIGAVGGIAAVAIGALVAWVIVTLAAPGDFAAGMAVPWALLAAVVLLGIGVASLAGLYPARAAAATSITESLKHFE
ncbi:MAG TPA: FtsX-like permease family protein [Candidatus Limnocylindria bacterium]|jgi:putative ABC transport system permease protein|nr:FtsX-like permease family protein [Candidatus Limnocylindria bacterium]